MDKTSRFYVVISWSIKLLVLYVLLSIILRIADIYLSQFNDVTEIIHIVLRYVRTFIIIGFVGGILYLGYASYMYLTSKFYIVTKIPVLKAMYFGYFDLAYAFDRLKTNQNEVEIDPTHKALIVHTETAHYIVLVREYFGKIQGTEKNNSWMIVKGKKKEYGRTDFRTKIPIENPLFELRDLKIQLEKKTQETYSGYIAITGFSKLPFVSDAFLNIFQVEGLME